MACSKYTLTNTGSTTTYFNYRRCDDSMWEYQVSLEPNQTRNIWLINGSYSSAYTTIVRTSSSAYPPSTESITIELTAGFFSGSIGAGFSAISNLPVNGQVEVTFICTLGTTTGDTISITSSVVIPVNQTEGFTQLFIDGDYTELDGTAYFEYISYSTTGVTVNISSTFTGTTFDVTPTPTNTPMPVTPTQTPTNSETPTQTPTNSETPTQTPTNSETPTQTPTNSETPTQTPTQTYTPTPSVTPGPAFFSVWSGSSVTLPLDSAGTYDFYVDWGDGNVDQITTWDQAEVTHTYATESSYNVSINGTINGWSFGGAGDAAKLMEIIQWGCLRLSPSTGGYFQGCTNLLLTNVADVINLTDVTSLSNMFKDCTTLTTINNIGSWDVSLITDMSGMFDGATVYNDDLSGWGEGTSSVTNMNYMFHNSGFNGDVSTWNVSSLLNCTNMFQLSSFVQPLSNWERVGSSLANLIDMSYMFADSSFNEDISNWNTSGCHYLQGVFSNNSVFNQDISSWDVSSVTDMTGLFNLAISFNQNLNSWNTSSVTTMTGTFSDATAFNYPLSGWDVSNVVDMTNFFANKLSTDYSNENIESTLCTWSALPTLQTSVNLDLGGINLSPTAFACKLTLSNSPNSWNVSYGSQVYDNTLSSGSTSGDSCSNMTTQVFWSPSPSSFGNLGIDYYLDYGLNQSVFAGVGGYLSDNVHWVQLDSGGTSVDSGSC